MAQYAWRDVGRIPQAGGVYAWYYVPEVTEYDADVFVGAVTRLKGEQGLASARTYVATFLEEKLFRYFREQPFTASIAGTLKPRFEGELHHRVTISDSLAGRLADDPRRLLTIKEVIEKSAPLFASPIYIGMSGTLKTRIAFHKRLIETYSANAPAPPILDDERDHSFAKEVCSRRIPLPRLIVVVQTVDEGDQAYIDCENILNRIHYPLFGRN